MIGLRGEKCSVGKFHAFLAPHVEKRYCEAIHFSREKNHVQVSSEMQGNYRVLFVGSFLRNADRF